MCKLCVHLVLSELIVVNNIGVKVIQNDVQAMKYIFIYKKKKKYCHLSKRKMSFPRGSPDFGHLFHELALLHVVKGHWLQHQKTRSVKKT